MTDTLGAFTATVKAIYVRSESGDMVGIPYRELTDDEQRQWVLDHPDDDITPTHASIIQKES